MSISYQIEKQKNQYWSNLNVCNSLYSKNICDWNRPDWQSWIGFYFFHCPLLENKTKNYISWETKKIEKEKTFLSTRKLKITS